MKRKIFFLILASVLTNNLMASDSNALLLKNADNQSTIELTNTTDCVYNATSGKYVIDKSMGKSLQLYSAPNAQLHGRAIGKPIPVGKTVSAPINTAYFLTVTVGVSKSSDTSRLTFLAPSYAPTGAYIVFDQNAKTNKQQLDVNPTNLCAS
jgi:hypothetical protein